MTTATALNRLKEHIANLSIAFVNTINARDWDSPLWENLSPTFSSKPEALSGGQAHLNGREAFLFSLKKLSSEHTTWKINVQTMTVNLSGDHTYAEVFTNSIATGEPVGIARPAMTRLEFRHEILPGQGGDLRELRN
ncbi:hypothetical protein PRZ48_004184 [Zasmidium cellare]|uniref:SnoaL-like domain-containing protein n=1 Tax=Zasmidium cellare TaxID=395010 RepID=A0ABR0EXW8_ZASCE|nr:hypothetical protein PRZ48_004184 [Zasmidium cellare]